MPTFKIALKQENCPQSCCLHNCRHRDDKKMWSVEGTVCSVPEVWRSFSQCQSYRDGSGDVNKWDGDVKRDDFPGLPWLTKTVSAWIHLMQGKAFDSGGEEDWEDPGESRNVVLGCWIFGLCYWGGEKRHGESAVYITASIKHVEGHVEPSGAFPDEGWVFTQAN